MLASYKINYKKTKTYTLQKLPALKVANSKKKYFKIFTGFYFSGELQG